MIQGIIGKKIRMTQLFDENGRVIPVTVLQAGPCLVVQKKDNCKVQLGLVESRTVKKVNKPLAGHFKKSDLAPTKILRDFYTEEAENLKVGDAVKAEIFKEKDYVNVVGTTKGKGFQGVVKRFGCHGGRDSHGSMFHRRIGSAGSNTFPAEVQKGKKMPGRMGGKRHTVKNLEVIKVDAANNLLWVKGAVPGFNGNYIMILKSSFKRRQ